MRIVHTAIAPPVVGTTREVSRYIIFPKRIGEETRFLERAQYLEKLVSVDEKRYWEATLWVNE